jgi:hypothetical protein
MDPFSALNEKKSCRDADRVDNRQRLEGLRAHWMLNIDGFCRTIRGAPPCGGTSMTLTGCAGSSGSYPDKSADGFDVAWRVSIVPERKPNAANAEVHSLLEIDGDGAVPEFVFDLLACDKHSRLGDEQRQNSKRLGLQEDATAVPA